MSTWLRYAIAFVVLCHGAIYVVIGAALPAPITQWNGTSWLLGGARIGRRGILAVRGLHVLAGVFVLACAFAIAFAPAWWRLPAVLSGIVGLAAFALFWDGQTQFLAQEGVIGTIFSLALLAGALAWP